MWVSIFRFKSYHSLTLVETAIETEGQDEVKETTKAVSLKMEFLVDMAVRRTSCLNGFQEYSIILVVGKIQCCRDWMLCVERITSSNPSREDWIA